MDIKYTPEGPRGKTCAECINFKAKEDPSKGTCYGHEVISKGSCNFFKKK